MVFTYLQQLVDRLALDLDEVGVHMPQQHQQLLVGQPALVEVDHAQVLLREVVAEQGLEVGRARGEDDLVRVDLLALDEQGDVAELFLVQDGEEVLLLAADQVDAEAVVALVLGQLL